MNSGSITNFGGNQSFTPRSVLAPRSEAELLQILADCRGRRIRTIGRLHSWSEAAVGDDVVLDLQHFRDVKVEHRDDKFWVTAGAGCQIKRLLSELSRLSAGTLPSLGLINEQTIAGAISTGTHGSGKSSMSNFIEEVRIAAYDSKTGSPVIRTIRGGDELRAARCSLGVLGIIVSIGFWSRPSYRVEEHFQLYADLENILAKEDEYPLQQFFLMPWSWEFIVQHRRETLSPRGGWATLYRLYVSLQFDVGLHLLVLLGARIWRSPRFVRFLFRHVAARLVIMNWKVVDDSSKMLVMEHELFRHIECELFVKTSQLVAAIKFVRQSLKYFDGDVDAFDVNIRDRLQNDNLLGLLDGQCGKYTHHYPICIRRVLPDDTLISMTAGAPEPSYALSFISYARTTDRQGFLAFAEFMTQAMGVLFDARPHWGKICPLTANDAARLYAQLPEFCRIASEFDEAGVFRNEWISRVLFPNEMPDTRAS